MVLREENGVSVLCSDSITSKRVKGELPVVRSLCLVQQTV